MIAAPFLLHRPVSAGEAAARLADAAPHASVLGGGTVLVPEMSAGRMRPAAVIDLARAGLAYVREEGGELVIGATATYGDLERLDRGEPAARLLARVAGMITGGAQIRNRATPAGSVAYANPASDMPPVLVALDARVRLLSAAGRREVPAAEFFTSALGTVRRPDELVEAIVVPLRSDGLRLGHHKLKFGESSWPIVTATVAALSDGTATAVVGGIASVPVVVRAASRGELAGELGALHWEGWSDVLADADYRRAVAPAIVERAARSLLDS